MIITFRVLLLFLLTFSKGVDVDAIFFEEISAADGNTINEDSMQRTPIIHKFFHQCSMKELCNYVIKNVITSKFTMYDSEDDLPTNRTGIRIWKKIYHGPLNDCRDAYIRGNKGDGIFQIKVPSFGLSRVRCDMTTTPKGWIVFQRRVDGTVDFYRKWVDYKNGFGNLNGNFLLGLEKLHQLAAPGKGAILRVDLNHSDLPGLRYAEYSLFEISSESDGYRLKIGGYSGNAGDSLAYHNNMKFTTKDNDLDVHPDINCAKHNVGAFWYKKCYASHLNGVYPPDSNKYGRYISWYTMPTEFGRIFFCEMKIRI